MRKLAYGTIAAVALSAVVAAGPAAAASGMPQLNYHDFPPQLVWLAVMFVVLYFIMSRLAVPAIEDTLTKREAKIQGDLDAAEKANDATRQAVAAYEKRLADAREQARRLQRERAEADSVAASQRLSELGEKLGGEIAVAEKRIADQRAQVLGGLEQMAGEVAAEVYAKLSGQPADAASLNAKVGAALKGGSR